MPDCAVPCIVCGKTVQQVDRDADSSQINQPYAATSFESYGHYGSTAWDPMDGSYIEINVCDDCLRVKRDEGHVLINRSARQVRVSTPKWRLPTVCGSQRVRNAPYKLWTEGDHSYADDDHLLLDITEVLDHANDEDIQWNLGEHLAEWVAYELDPDAQ